MNYAHMDCASYIRVQFELHTHCLLKEKNYDLEKNTVAELILKQVHHNEK